MKSESEQPQFLSFDLDQWRRDIQTFASATRQAIDAIVDDLSTQCSGSGGEFRVTRPVSDITPPVRMPATTKVAKSSVVRQSPSSRAADTNLSNDDRLAKLKSQLAERLAKHDQ